LRRQRAYFERFVAAGGSLIFQPLEVTLEDETVLKAIFGKITKIPEYSHEELSGIIYVAVMLVMVEVLSLGPGEIFVFSWSGAAGKPGNPTPRQHI
jgi:hypothetical protein